MSVHEAFRTFRTKVNADIETVREARRRRDVFRSAFGSEADVVEVVYTPIEHLDTLATGQSATPEELADLVRGLTVLSASATPAGASGGRASEEDLRELIALIARPGLGGQPVVDSR